LEKFRVDGNAGGGKFRVTFRDGKKGHGTVSESLRAVGPTTNQGIRK